MESPNFWLTAAIAVAAVGSLLVAYQLLRMEKQRDKIDLVIDIDWKRKGAQIRLFNNSSASVTIFDMFLSMRRLDRDEPKRERILRMHQLRPWGDHSIPYDLLQGELIPWADIMFQAATIEISCEILYRARGKQYRYRDVIFGPGRAPDEAREMNRVK